MTTQLKHIIKLISKHQAGTISASEREELTKWINENVINKKYFESLTNPNPSIRELYTYMKIDMEKEWQKISRPIRQLHHFKISLLITFPIGVILIFLGVFNILDFYFIFLGMAFFIIAYILNIKIDNHPYNNSKKA